MKTIKDLPEHSRPLDIQREIDAERALVEANRKLVEISEKKIQAKLAEVWDENV